MYLHLSFIFYWFSWWKCSSKSQHEKYDSSLHVHAHNKRWHNLLIKPTNKNISSVHQCFCSFPLFGGCLNVRRCWSLRDITCVCFSQTVSVLFADTAFSWEAALSTSSHHMSYTVRTSCELSHWLPWDAVCNVNSLQQHLEVVWAAAYVKCRGPCWCNKYLLKHRTTNQIPSLLEMQYVTVVISNYSVWVGGRWLTL